MRVFGGGSLKSAGQPVLPLENPQYSHLLVWPVYATQPNVIDNAVVGLALFFARLATPYWLYLLAAALHESGRTIDAGHVLDQALAQARPTGERWFECELYLLRSTVAAQHVALGLDSGTQAECDLRRPYQIADALASPSLLVPKRNDDGRGYARYR